MHKYYASACTKMNSDHCCKDTALLVAWLRTIGIELWWKFLPLMILMHFSAK